MLFSASAKAAGGSGFFFDDDAKAPVDSITVAENVPLMAANLPAGSDYTINSSGLLNVIPPTSGFVVESAKASKLVELNAAYEVAVSASLQFTSVNGQTKLYQADGRAIENLQRSLLGCLASQATPPGFYWLSEDNTQVPFTFDDMKQFAALIFANAAGCFARLQERKTALRNANSIQAVNGVVW